MRPLLTSLAVLILALTASSQDKPDTKTSTTDPVGTWKVTRTWFAGSADEKKDEFTLTISRVGDKLNGRAAWPDEDAPVDPRETPIDPTYQDGTLAFRTGRGQHVGDYSGKLDGDTIKGSFGVCIVSGTWEAKRVKGGDKKGPDPFSKEALHGSWESVEVTLVGGATTLDIRPDGKFKMEHRDVALGWTTSVSGMWELRGTRLTLRAQERLNDGRPVDVSDKKTEELSATRRGEGWLLGRPKGPELRKAAKVK